MPEGLPRPQRSSSESSRTRSGGSCSGHPPSPKTLHPQGPNNHLRISKCNLRNCLPSSVVGGDASRSCRGRGLLPVGIVIAAFVRRRPRQRRLPVPAGNARGRRLVQVGPRGRSLGGTRPNGPRCSSLGPGGEGPSGTPRGLGLRCARQLSAALSEGQRRPPSAGQLAASSTAGGRRAPPKVGRGDPARGTRGGTLDASGFAHKSSRNRRADVRAKRICLFAVVSGQRRSRTACASSARLDADAAAAIEARRARRTPTGRRFLGAFCSNSTPFASAPSNVCTECSTGRGVALRPSPAGPPPTPPTPFARPLRRPFFLLLGRSRCPGAPSYGSGSPAASDGVQRRHGTRPVDVRGARAGGATRGSPPQSPQPRFDTNNRRREGKVRRVAFRPPLTHQLEGARASIAGPMPPRTSAFGAGPATFRGLDLRPPSPPAPHRQIFNADMIVFVLTAFLPLTSLSSLRGQNHQPAPLQCQPCLLTLPLLFPPLPPPAGCSSTQAVIIRHRNSPPPPPSSSESLHPLATKPPDLLQALLQGGDGIPGACAA